MIQQKILAMLTAALALLAAQAAATPASTAPMPVGDAMRERIAERDAELFWAAFEGCKPAALRDILLPDFRMLHDQVGLAVADRASFIASLDEQCAARAPGGKNAGYRNRRLAVPGTRTVRRMGDWGALEEGAHAFYEWRGDRAGWEMVGGARYMHAWQWMGEEGRFRLSQSYSYDHGEARPYPPGGDR